MLNNPTNLDSELSIKELIENQTPEGKNIEYKSVLKIETEDDKKEFLADVASFANTAGGYLFYGISEDRGVPIEVKGQDFADLDKEKLRLESIIRDGIAPKLSNLLFKFIKLEKGGYVLVVYIPKSWSSPHMVVYKNSSRFFARHSGGKYQLDVYELRQMFLLTENVTENIKRFRLNRLSLINAGETPINMANKGKLVVHCLPLSAFQTIEPVNFSVLSKEFYKFFTSFSFRKFNIDGLVIYKSRNDTDAQSYIQIFRNGQFEFVENYFSFLSQNKKHYLISGQDTELNVMNLCLNIFNSLRVIGVEPPVLISMSLLSMNKHLILELEQNAWATNNNYGFDRSDVLIPEILIDEYPVDLDTTSKILRPIFDAFWNASGGERSWSYDENGTWKPKR